jgi:signal transduction histidine kinase
MKLDFKFRFAAFALAMGVMVFLISSAAVVSWRRIGGVRASLNEVQSDSLRIAEEFQRHLRQLNDTLSRYGSSHDPNDWQHYLKASDQLDTWIDAQKPRLDTRREQAAMLDIDHAYDDYRIAAREIQPLMAGTTQTPSVVAQYSRVRVEFERLSELGFNLAEAHRERTKEFLAAANRSFMHMGLLLFISLALLVVFGTGLGLLVYRDMIAPLRVKLVEVQALAERNEKLASLGMLAAGVAHEIRNPLTAIKAALFLQLKKVQPGSQDRADLDLVGKEITRLEHIVRDFLLFARPAEPKFVVVTADQPLRQVEKLFQTQLAKSNIRLVMDPAPTFHIQIDPEQMHQVLINLVQNAVDAMGHDGSVTLRVRADFRPLNGRTTDVVILEVTDTGPGIPADVAKRLFDPFFSTKSAGTGLGLSIAARIVEKHGGTLQYKTQLNHGTTFGIVLPRVSESVSA